MCSDKRPRGSVHFCRLHALLITSPPLLLQLPDSFADLQRLTLLDLSENQLIDFPVAICALPLRLDISHNRNPAAFAEHGPLVLPPEIRMLSSLTSLWASSNHIASLPPPISSLTGLRVLLLETTT